MFPSKFYYTAFRLVNLIRGLSKNTTQKEIPLNSKVRPAETYFEGSCILTDAWT